MKKRFEEVMDMVDFSELLKMKRDLDNGGEEINKIVEERIRKEIKKNEICCTVCTNKIKRHSENNFMLVFGPEEFKRKANFCGIDCMEYFTTHLKQLFELKEEPLRDLPDIGK